MSETRNEAMTVDEAIRFLMSRRHAASGTAIFVDDVILREMFRRVLMGVQK